MDAVQLARLGCVNPNTVRPSALRCAVAPQFRALFSHHSSTKVFAASRSRTQDPAVPPKQTTARTSIARSPQRGEASTFPKVTLSPAPDRLPLPSGQRRHCSWSLPRVEVQILEQMENARLHPIGAGFMAPPLFIGRSTASGRAKLLDTSRDSFGRLQQRRATGVQTENINRSRRRKRAPARIKNLPRPLQYFRWQLRQRSVDPGVDQHRPTASRSIPARA